jgi:hypothetical protein
MPGTDAPLRRRLGKVVGFSGQFVAVRFDGDPTGTSPCPAS